MAAHTISVTAVTRARGKILVTWEDGSQFEFLDVADLREAVRTADNVEAVRMLWLGYWLARSADLQDASAIVGKTLVVNLAAANPFRIL